MGLRLREDDRLGGHDPYSASKAAAELAIASWRANFCGSDAHQTSLYRLLRLVLATSLAEVTGPRSDCARCHACFAAGKPAELRSPQATRPWQHVLEPLGGYLRLAESFSAAIVMQVPTTLALVWSPIAQCAS